MKFSAYYSVASLFFLAAFVLPSTQASGLIIRAIDTDGTFVDCAAYSDLIGNELSKVYGDETVDGGNRRVLRSRELVTGWCIQNCKGFLPGTCQRAFPWCYGMRRNLDEDGQPVELDEDHTLACAAMQLAIHDKLLELATQVDDTCAAELLAPKEFKCYRVDQS